MASAQRITQCGSWELDLADLSDIDTNPLRWSDEVFRIFGHEPGSIEVTNENFFGAVHPDDRERIAFAVRTAIETGTTYAIDHRVIRPDGSIRVVHERSEIQYDDTGRPLKMIGTVQDVTEQRAREAQLLFRDRMVSIGALAAGVAHEINNPLVAVCANVDLLAVALSDPARCAGLPAEIHEYVRDARDGAERVRAIARDLVTFARSDDAGCKPVAVSNVLESALRLSAHEITCRATIVREYHTVPLVAGNEPRLAQVFLNLLRNAAQSITPGEPHRNQIRVSCRRANGSRVVVAIADTGGGIPVHLQSNIFSPFFTTKPAGEGTGLGLSICKRIVDELGGQIEFASHPGRGTEFRVTLPVAADQSSALPTSSPAPAVVVRRRVLVVDDEPLVTSAIRSLLGDEHDVTILNDPIAAHDLLVAAAHFDVILCDLNMPRMNGIELHDRLRLMAPKTANRMILMTGGPLSSAKRRLLEDTGMKVIEKPFAPELLFGLIVEIASR